MIEIKNLSFSYSSNQKVLKNVSLDIKRGEWVSILGHNGSGKSTLAKLLIGLLEANEGEIIVDGLMMNMKNLGDIRKKVGIVFQNPDNQFIGVTVRHDIAFGLENQMMDSKEMEEKVLEYAKVVSMENFLEHAPHHLSGGQKQRVALAGILAMEQDIIILDEATSMLDPQGTNEIVELIKRLNKERNKTVITITHDLAFAGLSDRLFVLKQGELILQGIPQEVFKEVDLLKSSNLEVPQALSVYNHFKNKKAPKALLEALWEFNSKM